MMNLTGAADASRAISLSLHKSLKPSDLSSRSVRIFNTLRIFLSPTVSVLEDDADGDEREAARSLNSLVIDLSGADRI